MSFILDALKKSETDRQRQSGPALFEVKIAPPRNRFPLWAVALVALLGVNAVIGGWLLLRHASHGEETAAATSNITPPAAPQSTAPQPSASAQTPSSAPPAVAAPTMPQHPAVAAATSPPPASVSSAALSPPVGTAQAAPGSAPIGAGGEPTLAASSREPAAPASQESAANPDDYAPAKEPAAAQGLANHVKVGTSSGYILYQDAALVPGANIPALRLDLHVYAQKPEERFALVNMRKVREGDTLPEGVRVEAIIPDGVVMSHNGMKFLLPRQ